MSLTEYFAQKMAARGTRQAHSGECKQTEESQRDVSGVISDSHNWNDLQETDEPSQKKKISSKCSMDSDINTVLESDSQKGKSPNRESSQKKKEKKVKDKQNLETSDAVESENKKDKLVSEEPSRKKKKRKVKSVENATEVGPDRGTTDLQNTPQSGTKKRKKQETSSRQAPQVDEENIGAGTMVSEEIPQSTKRTKRDVAECDSVAGVALSPESKRRRRKKKRENKKEADKKKVRRYDRAESADPQKDSVASMFPGANLKEIRGYGGGKNIGYTKVKSVDDFVKNRLKQNRKLEKKKDQRRKKRKTK